MTGLSVVAAGMVTPVGFNYRSSCAAIRAGVSGIRQANLWDGYSGKYLNAGKVDLPHWSVSVEKLADLAAPAIWECIQAAKSEPPDSIPILLGLSSTERPHRFPNLDEQVLAEIEFRLEHKLHSSSRVFPSDRVSAIDALVTAQALIRSGARYCVVAAVDSMLQQPLIVELIERNRILTELNSNGFLPGESGAALLVTSSENCSDDRLDLVGWGMTQELATIESDQPLRGAGLTRAIGDAMTAAGVSLADLDFRISDLNGEHYRFKEMTLAMARFQRVSKPKPFELWHPIEYIGDVGAAIGPLLIGQALHSTGGGYGVGPSVLVTLGNDDGRRAALVVRSQRRNIQ